MNGRHEYATAPPSRRLLAALIDLIVWSVVWVLTMLVLVKLARITLSIPAPAEPDSRDNVFVFSSGIGALCANLYLAIANGAGKSVGKALTGLRLVKVPGPKELRPGFARGLVRSALQAGPCMGAVMVATGWHDAFAGTKIVPAAEADTGEQRVADHTTSLKEYAVHSSTATLFRIVPWKIALAIILHGFFGMVYVIMSAI